MPMATMAMVLPPNPFEIIERDFKALTRRVTAHHILIPKSDEVALSLKQSIRNRVNPAKDSGRDPLFIVDAFSQAAEKYSRDDETASRGGLLGTQVPQGYCRAPELDRACFEVPLGQIAGPIETEFGYHLLLVVERTNCPKIDGAYNRIARGGKDGTDAIFVGDGSKQAGGTDQIASLALQQVGFWIAISLLGGVVAEIAAEAANIVETVPWK